MFAVIRLLTSPWRLFLSSRIGLAFCVTDTGTPGKCKHRIANSLFVGNGGSSYKNRAAVWTLFCLATP